MSDAVGTGRCGGAAPAPFLPGSPELASPAAVVAALRSVGYLADEQIATVVFLADRLGKPVLVEGPAGTGKTELAKSVAAFSGARLIRLQCYEGLDESKALYEWNYRKQLLRIQADERPEPAGEPVLSGGQVRSGEPVLSSEPEPTGKPVRSGEPVRSAPAAGATRGGPGRWQRLEEDIFSEEFLLARPLLEAIRSAEPVVLLIDEVDRVELETEALLFEVLSDFQVSIPELGTVRASRLPLVFLTSNDTRELSEALKRRCLYLHLDYPSVEREREILLEAVPEIGQSLADEVARLVRSLRALELEKRPSVSETLDWARTLLLLEVEHLSSETVLSTLNLLLKHRSDLETASKELALGRS